ncbi:EAL domain-containing protein [Halalkalibacter nanhaiisediminis]|uniref:EAL domain-containing protein (Putative c-di-GMP-specific phosphodiesterase class I) n=1 Tax=Halalkalibacter nanhaiisediminis TaxID=688079 RepID=A0A562QKE5_9BACI|nr:EAL domain-containing protein [Halalkalibacter nanhaiisediminis]TWI57175.1 EAL domain-containing protein (putative c-di-GMP-specific phosphodiesterase class I) [Halalkalibacter nanhaiisediminis]
MSSCDRCSQFPLLESKGSLLLYTKNGSLQEKLKSIVEQQVSEEGQVISLDYTSFEQLDYLLDLLAKCLSKGEKEQILGSYMSVGSHTERFPNMVSFDKLYERLTHREFLTIINQGMFTQYMQPIIILDNKQIFGYEFLLRQVSKDYPFFPGELFSFSQRAGLHSSLDSQARISSIQMSSKELKNGVKRFINFVPSSVYDPNHCLKSTFQAVEHFGVDPNDLVFEVVETEKIADIDHLKKIFRTYQEHGMKMALDDLGAGFSTLEVLQELKPDFAKIDRHLIDHCDENKEKQAQIHATVKIANEYGMTLLAEGIERKEEADFCQSLGISLGQGYFFGKPQPKPLELNAIIV